MKKIFVLTLFVTALMLFFSGCLKEKHPTNDSSALEDKKSEIVNWLKALNQEYVYVESTSVQSRTDYCDSGNTGCSDLGEVSRFVTLDNGCSMFVRMNVQLCGWNDPTFDEVTFSEVRVDISTSCLKVTAEIIQQAYDLFVDGFMRDFLSSNIDDYTCGTGETGISSSYSQITCTKNCIIKIGEIFVWRDLPCATEQACCIERNFWCVDPTAGHIVVGNPTKVLIGECSDFFEPEGFCFSSDGCSESECE